MHGTEVVADELKNEDGGHFENRIDRRQQRSRGVARYQLKFVEGPLDGQNGTHHVTPKRIEVPYEDGSGHAVYVRKNTRAGAEYRFDHGVLDE